MFILGQSGLVFDYQEGDFMKDSLTNSKFL